MKTLLTAILLFFSLFVSATNRYFSSSTGNDNTGDGLTMATAFASIPKLNSLMASFGGNDSILFKRGDNFTGTIDIKRSGTSSGSPLIFGAYGTGSYPVITSLVTISSWVSLGNSVYESASPVTALTTLNLLLVRGTSKAYGRYPNANATSGGYDSILSHSGTTTITLNNPLASFTGGELVTRPRRWLLDRLGISSRTGNTFTVTGATVAPYDKYGYWIQNSPSVLDLNYEWCFIPATKKVRINFPTTPSGIQVATLANIITATSRTNIKFVNLEINGSNSHAVLLAGCTNIQFVDCSIKNAGADGVNANTSTTNLTFTSDSIQHCSNNGIKTNGNNITITNPFIDSCYMLPGMGMSGESQGMGIMAQHLADGLTVSGGSITNCGYNGIYWKNDAGQPTSNNVLIENVYINGCTIVKDDGGCIYTWSGSDNQPVYLNRIIRNCICLNAVGNLYGTGGTTFGIGHGFYGDVGASDLDIYGCLFDGNGRAGLYFNHGAKRNRVHDNKFYANGVNGTDGKGAQFYFNETDAGRITGNTFSNNEVWATGTLYLVRAENNVTSTNGGTAAFSNTFDSNYYVHASSKTTPFYTKNALGTIYYTFKNWRAASFGPDAHGDTSTLGISYVIRDLYTLSDTSYPLLGYNWINARKSVFSGAYLSVSAYGSAIIKRTTISGNNPPSAILSSPTNGATYTSPGTVIINASAFAQNSTITNVKFYENGVLLNTDATAPYSYTWTSVAPGTYTITAVALASNGLTGSSLPATITVGNSPPTVSITSPLDGATFIPPASIPVNITAADANGSISRVDFYLDNVFAGTDASSPYSLTITGVGAGGKAISVWAVDDLGDSTKASINVVVAAANTPPTIYISLPTQDTVIIGAATISLNSSTTDADGIVTGVNYYDNGVFIHHEAAAPWLYNQALSLGVHKIKAVATDDDGDSTTSLIRTITITNIPPSISITSPVNDTSYLDPASIVINVTASDDGSVSTVHFYKNGVYVGLDNSSPYTITLTGVVAGGYTLTATAVDNLVDSTSASVNITVVTPTYIPPDDLSINVQIISPIQCSGENATVEISATGGTPPYTGTGTQSKPTGLYQFIVDDNAGLHDTLNLNIPEPAPLTLLSIDTTAILSYGGTCYITANVTGGTPDYSYSLNGGNYVSASSFLVSAGTHTISIRDQHGCTTSGSVTVHQPAPAGNTYQIHGHKHRNISL